MSRVQDVRPTALDSADTDDGMDIGGMKYFPSRDFHLDLHRIPRNILRQILGWRPFDRSYFALYQALDDFESRSILLLAVVLAAAAGTPLPIIAVSVFSNVVNSFPPPEAELVVHLKQLLGIAVAYFLVTWGWSLCWGIVGERITRRIREDVVKKALYMGVAEYDQAEVNVGDLLGEKALVIHTGTSEKVGLLIQSISYFISAFVAGFTINVKLTAVLFAIVIPPLVLFITTGSVAVSKFSGRASAGVNCASQIAEGAIKAVKTVQAFCIGDLLAEKHHSILQRADSTMRLKSIASGLMIGSVYFVMYAASSISYWEGARLVGNRAGDIFAVTLLVLDASFVFGQVGGFLEKFGLAAAAGSEILAFQTQLSTFSDGAPVDSETWDGEISFRDVTFSYETRSGSILRSVSLSIKLGSTVGIVGGSGSGKSTLVSLIMRFHNPTSGEIAIGGRRIDSLSLKSWRSHISLLDQEPVIFSGTIMDNIASGLLDQNMARDEVERRCIEAARSAYASFIWELPDGLNTWVGPLSNCSLSGGQLQRICLARALIRKPSLLLLDEPTSALDARSEEMILRSLREVSLSGCTVIMIAHRLSTVKSCDSIIVMGQGSILEEGTHEELLQHGAAYKGLVEAQKLKSMDTNQSMELSKFEELSVQDHLDSKSSLSPGSYGSDESSGLHETLSHDRLDPGCEARVIPLHRLFLRCLALSSKEKWLLLISSLASCISGGIIVGESIIFGNLVDLINSRSSNPGFQGRINFFATMFVVIAVIALVSQTVSVVGFGIASQKLVTRTRDTSLRTILQQDMAWFSKPQHSPFTLMAKVNTESAHLSGLSGPVIGVMCSVCVSITGGIILAHVVAWRIAVVLLSTVPVMVMAGFVRLRVLSISEKRQETAYNAATAIATEACSQLRTVAAFGREPAVFHQFQVALTKPYRKGLKFSLMASFSLAVSLAIPYFAYTLAYWWSAKQVREGKDSQRAAFTTISAIFFATQSAGQVLALASELTRAKQAAQSIFNLHDQESSLLRSDSDSKGSEKNSSLQLSTGDLSATSILFDDVSFRYAGRSKELVLKNLKCKILPGQFIGIVGPSGSGKSSFINLLLRFWDPLPGGSIKFDDRDIRTESLVKHRSRISLVSQEPDLFPGSIKFNVSLGGDCSTSQEEIEAACKQCNLHDFITSLPDGYETECYSASNGSTLSGGEKQRVAIARALIRKPGLLLLDEATSALDAHSQASIAAMIASTRNHNRTTIAVAHRLSAVRDADSIIVLDKGEIVDMGTHQDLLGRGGIYAELVRTQEIG